MALRCFFPLPGKASLLQQDHLFPTSMMGPCLWGHVPWCPSEVIQLALFWGKRNSMPKTPCRSPVCHPGCALLPAPGMGRHAGLCLC